MNLERLYAILDETTTSFRKGEPVVTKTVGIVQVVEVFAMDHQTDAPHELEKVDVVFMVVGVDKAKAETHRAELVALLRDYPEPERLAAGPSYIEVGGWLESQDAALRLFALGHVLGLWKVMTPECLGVTGQAALDLAGRGFVMITGFAPAAPGG